MSERWGSDRFFHLDGVWEGPEAKRETGKGGLDEEEGEEESDEVVNG